ncbi:DUF4440 domain-containing protein [Hoeflea sp. TYP-13]|uniref:YybH family protein n=1 Tax=Hoeflea sp. TYP-13 TaxID=3230023 RepID=UPI0034C5BA81
MTAQVKNAIDENNAAMMSAFAVGDLKALGALYTDNARFMLPNADPAVGRSQIESAFGGMISAGLKALELQTDELVEKDDTVVEIGSYTLKVAGDAVADSGSYMVLWQSTGEGWLISRDIVCSSVTQPV